VVIDLASATWLVPRPGVLALEFERARCAFERLELELAEEGFRMRDNCIRDSGAQRQCPTPTVFKDCRGTHVRCAFRSDVLIYRMPGREPLYVRNSGSPHAMPESSSTARAASSIAACA